MILRGGAYGEHQIREVTVAGVTKVMDDRFFTARPAPGAGAELVIRDDRYVTQPTMSRPWYGDVTPAAWGD